MKRCRAHQNKSTCAIEVLQKRQGDHATHVFTYEGRPVVQVNTRAWRGNDETEYTRKWEGRGIQALKLPVKLAVNWVENVLLTQKYAALGYA
jgi:hypothetical protein